MLSWKEKGYIVMNICVFFHTIIIFFLLLSSCRACDLIVGKWVQANLTKGGLGGIFIFDRGGQATLIFGAITESTFRIENNYLIEIHKDDNSKPGIERYLIKGTSNRLILEAVHSLQSDKLPAKQLTLDRIGHPEEDEPVLVGKWSANGPRKGSKILLDYTKSGNMLKCYLLEYNTGHYFLDNNILTILPDGGKPYVREIRRIQNELIFLENAKKKGRDLHKIRY